jgi:hypothetical protein
MYQKWLYISIIEGIKISFNSLKLELLVVL